MVHFSLTKSITRAKLWTPLNPLTLPPSQRWNAPGGDGRPGQAGARAIAGRWRGSPSAGVAAPGTGGHDAMARSGVKPAADWQRQWRIQRNLSVRERNTSTVRFARPQCGGLKSNETRGEETCGGGDDSQSCSNHHNPIIHKIMSEHAKVSGNATQGFRGEGDTKGPRAGHWCMGTIGSGRAPWAPRPLCRGHGIPLPHQPVGSITTVCPTRR